MMMILAVVATLMHQYADISRHSAKKDAAGELRTGLEAIRSELLSATTILSPSFGGGSTGVLEFERIDPDEARGIPAVLVPSPAPAPLTWDPRDPGYLMTVRYERLASHQRLMRRVDGGSPQTVFSACTFFSASPNERTIFLTGSVQEEKIVKSYQVQLALPEGTSW